MRVPRYRVVLYTAFLAALLFFILQMRTLPGGAQRGPAPKGFELLDTLMRLIRNDYLEERDPVRTAEGAYRGLVNSLDSLSAYLDKELTARYLARNPSEKETGVVLFKRYGSFPQVLAVIEDSPAAKAGIRPGDLLSALGHRNTLSMSLLEAELLLSGPDEGPVAVKVLRGAETLELSVGRAVLFPKPFVLTREAGRPAVLSVRRFSPSLAGEVRREVGRALGDRKKPLVVDLRNAAGGDIGQARAFVNIFVQAASIGSLEKRGGIKENVACPAEADLARVPLAVWVNAGTMGAAEFVAGVLQEVRKVKIVGSPTVGIAGQRELFPLKDESSVLLTSGIFVLPSGRSLWGEGLKPDVSVPFDKQGDKIYHEKTLPLLAGL